MFSAGLWRCWCKLAPFWRVSDEAGWIDLPIWSGVSTTLPRRTRVECALATARCLRYPSASPGRDGFVRARSSAVRPPGSSVCALHLLPSRHSGFAVSAVGQVFAVWDASPSREEALKAHGAASQWADVHWVTRGVQIPQNRVPLPIKKGGVFGNLCREQGPPTRKKGAAKGH